MGMYINPPDMSKEQFLQVNGFQVSQTEAKACFPVDKVYPVCLVDNGPFTAAAIAFSEDEFEAFTQPHDVRPKMWFVVHEDDLKPYMK